MTSRKLLVGLLLGILCCGPVCRAATQRPVGLPELVAKADLIVVGTVISRTSAWNAEHSRINTQTTLRIEESLKGAAGQTIVIETPGGIVGGRGMMAAGAAVFRPGEKQVVFLVADRKSGVHRVFGWAQGQFRVQRDRSNGRERVSRRLDGVTLMPGAGRSAAANASVEHIEYLDQLKLAIHQLRGR